MTPGMIIGGVLIAIFLYFTFRPRPEKTVTIKSTNKDSGRVYTAKLIRGLKGDYKSDWRFYDELGNLLEDILITDMLFDILYGYEGDDYLDSDFYIDDEEYYNETTDTTIVEEISAEETVIDDVTTESTHTVEDTVTEITPEDSTYVEPTTTFEETTTKSSSSYESSFGSSNSSSDYSSSDSGGDFD